MTIKAPDVATYVNLAPVARQAALLKLRQLCLTSLAGYEECMEFGMPAYKRNGVLEVAFASQKNYISLYVMEKLVVDEYRAALADLDIGKGCIRFPRPEKIDFDVVEKMLKKTVESNSQPC